MNIINLMKLNFNLDLWNKWCNQYSVSHLGKVTKNRCILFVGMQISLQKCSSKFGRNKIKNLHYQSWQQISQRAEKYKWIAEMLVCFNSPTVRTKIKVGNWMNLTLTQQNEWKSLLNKLNLDEHYKFDEIKF